MFVYESSLATAGNLTTNGTANTETETFRLNAVTQGRNVALQSIYLIGKGAGLTAISGIALRVITWGTGATVGTAITPAPKDQNAPAASATAASRPTAGTTRTNRIVIGCGAAGPGGWVAPNPDSTIAIRASATPQSIDGLDVSGTVSLNFEFSFEHQE